MTYAAKILADSLSPDQVRLTTFEVTMPRIVLAEFNTHRMFSRNSASSRAIPVKKMIARVMEDPYIPSSWGKNQKGMQASEDVNEYDVKIAKMMWLDARDAAVKHAKDLSRLGIHKQLTNRLLEPFMWHTCIVTATEWSNFFHLRNHKDAHPDIQIPARLMQEAMEESVPVAVDYDGWHLPLMFNDETLIMDNDLTVEEAVKVSIARCGRVSYLTHDGKRDTSEDLKLYDRLLASGHMSPLEQVARPMTTDEQMSLRSLQHDAFKVIPFCGNFRGWIQHRKLIPNEVDILGARL